MDINQFITKEAERNNDIYSGIAIMNSTIISSKDALVDPEYLEFSGISLKESPRSS